jgi:hypothetical protein
LNAIFDLPGLHRQLSFIFQRHMLLMVGGGGDCAAPGMSIGTRGAALFYNRVVCISFILHAGA